MKRMVTTCVLGVGLWTAIMGCSSTPEPQPPPPPPPQTVAPPPPPPPPTVTPCDATQSLTLSATMQARAPQEAPGMKPDGASVCQNVPEGQTFSGPVFTLEQGYCYTFLGNALPPVSEMDMEVRIDLAPGSALPPALAALANDRPILVDTEAGIQSAMATKANCYQWPFPIPGTVKLVLKATRGGGPLAAQVYRKKKF